MLIWSGPVDLLVLEFWMACFTSSGVRIKFGSGFRCLIFLSIFRYSLLVV